MEPECCLKLQSKQVCSETDLMDCDDLTLNQIELIQIRAGIENIQGRICKKHFNQYIKDYSYKQYKCEDPFNIHKNRVRTNLHEISLEEFKTISKSYEILPGQKLCRKCLKDAVKEKEKENQDKEMVEQMEIDMSYEEAKEKVNESLQLLDCSPIKYVKSERVLSLGKKKIDNVTRKFRNAVAVTLSEPELKESDCDNCSRLVEEIKKKMTLASKQERIQLLSIVPEDWSIQKTVEFFGVTEYSVKLARKLKKEKGILAISVIQGKQMRKSGYL